MLGPDQHGDVEQTRRLRVADGIREIGWSINPPEVHTGVTIDSNDLFSRGTQRPFGNGREVVRVHRHGRQTLLCTGCRARPGHDGRNEDRPPRVGMASHGTPSAVRPGGRWQSGVRERLSGG
jgi:hypothetical protein